MCKYKGIYYNWSGEIIKYFALLYDMYEFRVSMFELLNKGSVRYVML